MAKPDSQWYRLDNAGILYSALQREEYSAIYRFSALMTEPVRPAALQNAIDRVLPRFPSFAVRIRRGLFWYYRERVCQDDFCKFSKFKYLSAEKSPNISCRHIS